MHKGFCVHVTHTTLAVAVCIALAQLVWAGDGPAASHQPLKIFELAIANGRVGMASNTIRVKKGDEVELRWSTDRPISLHLHGYDIERRVTPQSPATMAFKAHIAGRFSVSEHGGGEGHRKALLYLEVYP